MIAKFTTFKHNCFDPAVFSPRCFDVDSAEIPETSICHHVQELDIIISYSSGYSDKRFATSANKSEKAKRVYQLDPNSSYTAKTPE